MPSVDHFDSLSVTNAIDRNYPFRVGERLVYKIYWGMMCVGEATLAVEDELVDEGGNRIWRLVARSKSNSFFDTVYPVKDTIQSYVDADRLFSYRYVEDRLEGSRRYDKITDFNYEEMTGRILDRRKSKVKVFNLQNRVQDSLSCVYFLRSRNADEAGSLKVPAVNNNKVYEVGVKSLGKKKVSTPFGKIETLGFEPEATYEGLFNRKGKMYVWISNDEYKIPVLMTAKVPFGSVRAVLTEVRGVEGWPSKK